MKTADASKTDKERAALRAALVAYLNECRTALGGISLTAMAKRAKMDPSNLTRLVNPKTKHGPSLKTLSAVARLTGLPIPSAIVNSPIANPQPLRQDYGTDSGAGSARSTPTPIPHPAAPLLGPLDLPVLGRAQGGTGVLRIQTDETPIEWTNRPAQLIGVSEAYALHVVGDSIAPAYNHGDIAYVHPGWPIAAGNVVVVQLADDTAVIKVYVSESDDVVRLRQLAPAGDLTVPKDRVRAIHRVMGKIESR